MGREVSLECSNLSKDFYVFDDTLNWRIVFRDTREHSVFSALKNVNLVIPKGKFVGVLGRNGAGKSTLLRVLGGIYPPTTGVVNVNGQVNGLFEMGGMGSNRLSGYAYAARFLSFFNISKSKRKDLINQIHEFSELGNDFFKPIYTYSSGMSARLYFSTATQLQHDIYLVDELLSVGDEHFQAKCWKRLRERFSAGASGVLVTHDWAAVLKLCEHSYILDKGEFVASGPSEKIVQQYLNLPLPTKDYVEIITKPYQYEFTNGQDCLIQFDILQKQDVRFAVSYSVDLFRPGYGWELILLNEDFVAVDSKIGINHYQIKIKQLPLAAGNYYLNLFVKLLDNDVDQNKMDVRSWTHGNGIKFKVVGSPSDAATLLPWNKKSLVEQYVPN